MDDRQFKMQFFDNSKISMLVKMEKFNMNMRNVFEKFNYCQFPVYKLELWVNKLKYEELKEGQDTDFYREQLIFAKKNDHN